jgi:hypothetical protein
MTQLADITDVEEQIFELGKVPQIHYSCLEIMMSTVDLLLLVV